MLIIDKKFNKNRNDMHPLFEKFYLIKDAVNLSEKNGKLPIFSCDKPKSKIKGSKLFYTSSYERFWIYYELMTPDERCFYETLLPDIPCHLYADIEASKLTNKDVDFEELYANVIDSLRKFMIEKLKVADEDIRIIELDSSTNQKFSKHCVVKVKDCYFQNNFHCGAFMRRFQKHIVTTCGPNSDNKFFVWGDKEKEFKDKSMRVFFVDMGVYTLRRQFRLLGSSKRTTPRRFMWLKEKKGELCKNDFFDCLIQYIPIGMQIKKVFKVKEINGDEPYSRSLKTFDKDGNPISIAQNNIRRPITATTSQSQLHFSSFYSTSTQQQQSAVEKSKSCPTRKNNTLLPNTLQHALRTYLTKKYKYTIKSYVVNGDKIKLETYDSHCYIRKEMTGDPMHSNNHIFIIIYADNLLVYQGCYNLKYCKNGTKKLLHSFGTVDRTIEEGLLLVRELRRWRKSIDPSVQWLPIAPPPSSSLSKEPTNPRKKRKTI